MKKFKSKKMYKSTSIKKYFYKFFISFCLLIAIVIGTSYINDLGYEDERINNLINEIEINKQINEISNKRLVYKSFIEKEAINHNTNLKDTELSEVSSLIVDMTQKYDNLNVQLITSVISVESGWKTSVISSAYAIGMMQIVRSTGSYLAYIEGIEVNNIETILTNPKYNIKLGCRYLSELGGISSNTTLISYNAGPKYAMLYNKNKDTKILPEETQKYIINVNKYIVKGKTKLDGYL